MQDIESLISTSTNIRLEVSPEDLNKFGTDIAERAIQAFNKEQESKSEINYLSAETVCKLLDIARSTLWQWDKKGITKPIRMGNLKRYKASDIQDLGINKD